MSNLSCWGKSGSNGIGALQTVLIAPLSTENIPLILKSEFTKVEIEYGMKVDGAIDKIEAGRLTILWDQISALKTSHEQEDSTNLGSLDLVTIVPWHDATSVGISIVNNYGDPLTFEYYIVNTFNITYTP